MLNFKTSKFQIGQIWYWNDPVYSTKAKGPETIPPGEANIRYSRNVLILQRPESINGCVLVAPLSGTKYRETDIPITMKYFDEESTSYIKINKIMNVTTRSLERYITSVTPELMNYIQIALMYYFCMDGNTYVDDRLLNIFMRSARADEKSFTASTEPKISSTFKEDKVSEKVTTDKNPKKRRRYDDDFKKEFMKFLKDHSMVEVAKHFEIDISSCYKYRKAWKDFLNIEEESISENHFKVIDKIQKTSSKLSNWLVSELRDQNVFGYNLNIKYLKDPNALRPMSEEFYQDLSAGIYYGFLNGMNVIETTESQLHYLDNNIEAVNLAKSRLDNLQGVIDIISDKFTPTPLRNRLKEINYKFDPKLIAEIKGQLSTRLDNLNNDGINSIMGIIESLISG